MWRAVLDDGSVVSEESGAKWPDIKNRVSGLSYVMNGVAYSLPPNQKRYLRADSASVFLTGGEATVDSRWIGFETHSGAVVKLRFHLATGNVSVEVE